jgi:hypothetical protein
VSLERKLPIDIVEELERSVQRLGGHSWDLTSYQAGN